MKREQAYPWYRNDNPGVWRKPTPWRSVDPDVIYTYGVVDMTRRRTSKRGSSVELIVGWIP